MFYAKVVVLISQKQYFYLCSFKISGKLFFFWIADYYLINSVSERILNYLAEVTILL